MKNHKEKNKPRTKEEIKHDRHTALMAKQQSDKRARRKDHDNGLHSKKFPPYTLK